MTLNYILTEDDYLQSKLFIASKNKTVKRTRKRNWIILMAGFFIAGLVSLLRDDTFSHYYFFIVTLLVLLFYPTYQKGVYKRHYRKFNKENLAHHFNLLNTVIFNPDFVEMTDKTGSTKLNIDEIDEITEIEKYFYLRTKSNAYLIFPKDRVNELENVQLFFINLAKKLNIDFKTELNWQWR